MGENFKYNAKAPKLSFMRGLLLIILGFRTLSVPLHSSQGSHRDWNTWKMKVVMQKSWNMKNWPKVMEFCDQSWNFTNFKIKHLFCAHTGCRGTQNRAPGEISLCSGLYNV